MVFLKKLVKGHIWKRIFMERLTEPMHLNVLSVFVALFGSYRSKIAFDLIVRQHNAFCILKAADFAKARGIREVYLLEFGVAAGAGLMNMAEIAARVTHCTGVKFRIAGFDTGEGMPPAVDYRDHPEHYQEGDYQMNFEALRARLPENAELILGKIGETVPSFLKRLDADCPIGYVVLDVDYYSSSKNALAIFEGAPEHYLPILPVFLDDVMYPAHNSWCGERLAVREFNETHERRKIEHHVFLEYERIFRKVPWIRQVCYCHILDHKERSDVETRRSANNLVNPYLS